MEMRKNSEFDLVNRADGESESSSSDWSYSSVESFLSSDSALSLSFMVLIMAPQDGGDEMINLVRSWPRAGVYARVSTRAQEDDGTSLDTQVEGCVAGALMDGYSVADEHIWRDTASGVSAVRTVWTRALEAVQGGEVELVYIYDPDCLASNALLLLNLREQVEERGGMVRFMHGPSMETGEGKLMAYVTGFVPGKGRLQIGERTMRAKRGVASQGRTPVGVRGSGIFGYDYDPVSRKRTINEEEAVIVRLIFEWDASGRSSHAIADELNERGVPTKRGNKWRRRMVENVLRRTSYIGVDYYARYRCGGVYSRRYTKDEEKGFSGTRRLEGICLIKMEGFSPRIVSDERFEGAERRDERM